MMAGYEGVTESSLRVHCRQVDLTELRAISELRAIIQNSVLYQNSQGTLVCSC